MLLQHVLISLPVDCNQLRAFRSFLPPLHTDSALFSSDGMPCFAQVYGSLIGMFEQNNLAIDVPSPLGAYLNFVDGVDDGNEHEIHRLIAPLRDTIVAAAQDSGQG